MSARDFTDRERQPRGPVVWRGNAELPADDPRIRPRCKRGDGLQECAYGVDGTCERCGRAKP